MIAGDLSESFLPLSESKCSSNHRDTELDTHPPTGLTPANFQTLTYSHTRAHVFTLSYSCTNTLSHTHTYMHPHTQEGREERRKRLYHPQPLAGSQPSVTVHCRDGCPWLALLLICRHGRWEPWGGLAFICKQGRLPTAAAS